MPADSARGSCPYGPSDESEFSLGRRIQDPGPDVRQTWAPSDTGTTCHGTCVHRGPAEGPRGRCGRAFSFLRLRFGPRFSSGLSRRYGAYGADVLARLARYRFAQAIDLPL